METVEKRLEKWKKRSLEATKELKALRTQIRDLSRSRDLWKEEVQELKFKNQHLLKKEKELKQQEEELNLKSLQLQEAYKKKLR